jgi:Leucine-rich repeat (LRR) protein
LQAKEHRPGPFQSLAAAEEDSYLGYSAAVGDLDLSDNDITVLTSESLTGLEKLQTLYLQRNRLTTLGLSTFKPIWSNLMDSTMLLDISGNLVNDPYITCKTGSSFDIRLLCI